MRQYKFRGQRVDNKQWIYGYYMTSSPEFHIGTKHFIVCGDNQNSYCGRDFIEVIPETVGQYTGLKDKNGKEIYEFDIVSVQWDNGDKDNILIGWAECDGAWGYSYGNDDDFSCALCSQIDEGQFPDWKTFEVVGNKFQNPELLNQ